VFLKEEKKGKSLGLVMLLLSGSKKNCSKKNPTTAAD